MKRICYSVFHIGERFFGDNEPLHDRSETHGYCPDCLPKELAKIREIQDEDRIASAGLKRRESDERKRTIGTGIIGTLGGIQGTGSPGE